MTTTASSRRAAARAITQPGGGPPRGALRAWLGPFALSLHSLLMFLFLYLPVGVLVLFSFNESRFLGQWSGFSLKWYAEMLADRALMQAFGNSLVVALISTLISTLLGTLAALAMERFTFRGQGLFDGLLYLPVIIPDIAMAIMLLAFFHLTGFSLAPLRLTLGDVRLAVPLSVIIGHVAFNVSFVAIIVRARLANMDRSLEEAAGDLYAGPWRAFWHVTLPGLLPGIIAGALLAFTFSLDDFVITFFISGAGYNTLPVYVFGLVRRGVTPKINAISTLMLLLSLGLVLISVLLQGKGDLRRTSIEV